MNFIKGSISNKILVILVPFLIFFGLSIGFLGYKTLVSNQKESIKIATEDGLIAISYTFNNFIDGILSNTRNLSNTKEFIKINPETYELIIEKHVQAHSDYKFDLSYLIYFNQKSKKYELISKGHDFLYSPEGEELNPFENHIINILSKDGSLDLRETSRQWHLFNIKSSSLNQEFPDGYDWLKKEPNKMISILLSANEIAGHHGFVVTVTILKDGLKFIDFIKNIGQVGDKNLNTFVIKNSSKYAGTLTIGHLPGKHVPFYKDLYTDEAWKNKNISFEIYRDLRDFEQSKKIILLEVVSLVFLSSLILWLLIYFLISGITKPLKELQNFSQELEEGKLDTLMPKLPVNEIGNLGKAFDKMRHSIFEKIKIIKNDKDKLEAQTVELTEKTKKLRMILENINQGIFSIGIEKIIENEYSLFTEKILSIEKLPGKSYISVLLDQCDLKADEKSRIESAIDSILGESHYTFELNSDHLPSRLKLKNGSTIHTNIIPIILEDKKVDKLLFSIRDLSEIINAQKKFENKQEEVEIIGELIGVDPNEFKRFNTNYIQQLTDAIVLICESDTDQSRSIFEKIFRLLHTLKGQSRAYNFSNIADSCHKAEDVLTSWKEDPNLETKIITDSLQSVISELIRYKDLFNDKLSRRNLSSHDHLKIGYIKDLILDQNKSSKALIADIQSFLEGKVVLFNQLLDPLIGMIENLSKELGKPAPKFKITGGNHLVSTSISDNISFALIHIFRNCLDHGIEKPVERKKNNKPEFGTIDIDWSMQEAGEVLSIKDDGKGLDLYSVYNKALKGGIIKSNDKINSELICSIVLKSGFSTREKVTDISGRGVGMDVVYNEVQKINGDLKLIFHDKIPESLKPDSSYATFNIEISIPVNKTKAVA